MYQYLWNNNFPTYISKYIFCIVAPLVSPDTYKSITTKCTYYKIFKDVFPFPLQNLHPSRAPFLVQGLSLNKFKIILYSWSFKKNITICTFGVLKKTFSRRSDVKLFALIIGPRSWVEIFKSILGCLHRNITHITDSVAIKINDLEN